MRQLYAKYAGSRLHCQHHFCEVKTTEEQNTLSKLVFYSVCHYVFMYNEFNRCEIKPQVVADNPM